MLLFFCMWRNIKLQFYHEKRHLVFPPKLCSPNLGLVALKLRRHLTHLQIQCSYCWLIDQQLQKQHMINARTLQIHHWYPMITCRKTDSLFSLNKRVCMREDVQAHTIAALNVSITFCVMHDNLRKTNQLLYLWESMWFMLRRAWSPPNPTRQMHKQMCLRCPAVSSDVFRVCSNTHTLTYIHDTLITALRTNQGVYLSDTVQCHGITL